MTTRDEPPGSHLPAQTVSAYLDRSLSPGEVAEVEAHLDSCAECRADVAEVAALLARRRRRRRLAVALPALAAAAAVFLVFRTTMTGPPIDRFRTDSSAGPGSATRIAIIAPLESATLLPDSILFRWRSTGGAPGSALYRITLTDERGNLAWKSETRDTMVAPAGVRFEPGKTYFWYVDALLPDARSATTGIHSIRISP